MPNSTSPIKRPLYMLVAVLCGAGQSAYAHTTIKDKEVNEGSSTYTAAVIGHGCEDPEKKDANGNAIKFPVLAQSVVIPTVSPIVTRPDPNDSTKTLPVTLTNEIDAANGLAGLVDLVQDKNIFAMENEKYDGSSNLIGFYGKGGKLQTNLRGLVPFRFNAPKFKTDSCAKKLVINLAIADICKLGVFPPKDGTANLWMPSLTTTFPNTVDGIGAAPKLTVKRTSDLPAGCNGGYDVTVTPSEADIDANLPIPGWGKR